MKILKKVCPTHTPDEKQEPDRKDAQRLASCSVMENDRKNCQK